MDYGYFEVDDVKKVVLTIVDAGTAYGEGATVQSRNLEVAWEAPERCWICIHGQPRAVSGGDEFNNKQFRTLLLSRGIEFHLRPARRSNKIVIVERKHGTVKRILERLAADSTKSSPELLIARSLFSLTSSLGRTFCPLSSRRAAIGLASYPPHVAMSHRPYLTLMQNNVRLVLYTECFVSARPVPSSLDDPRLAPLFFTTTDSRKTMKRTNG